MEASKVRYKIPAFGNWDLSDDQTITQYFDVKKQPISTAIPPNKVKKSGHKGKVQRKQMRVCDLTPTEPQRLHREPKAVDEDLYKIPPELLRPQGDGFLDKMPLPQQSCVIRQHRSYSEL
ncbi:hypothetical protein QJS10_CPB04g01401 [Acorus calamus]|uniref:RIN4 pathogenic type III effector avirulence factor Avr cleavage site domain-containing protein n=1 Tax=Acorus calamus TaxID=4465 RepID=A0AAV9EYX3_ACOCL|nr:hypothetical protein QJS10_CPB04g01401 [Acorus calamus]